ncbi:NAD(P)-dependent oxidoreductase [Propionibacteriaceae bacterium Y2011]
MTTIGVVGLGNMGLPIATGLAVAGGTVLAHDRAEQARRTAAAAGLRVRQSLAAVAAESNVVVLSLPTPDVVGNVVHALAEAGPADLVVLDTSTTDPATSRELAGLLPGRFADCPILGRPHAAGGWTIPVGGDEAAAAVAATVLAPMARRIVHVGGPGAGATLKVINNLMLSMINSANAEALALAGAAGVELERFVEVLSDSGAASISGLFRESAPRVAADDFDAVFAVRLMRKDAGLGLALAADVGLELPVAAASTAALDRAIAMGLADEDASAVIKTVGTGDDGGRR